MAQCKKVNSTLNFMYLVQDLALLLSELIEGTFATVLKQAEKLSTNEVNFVFQYGLRCNLSIKANYAAKSKIIRLFSDFSRPLRKQ